MKSLALAFAAICPAFVSAVPVTYSPDMTKYSLSHYGSPSGTTLGYVASAANSSLTLVGATGPLQFRQSGTQVFISTALPSPMEGTPVGPIPRTTKAYAVQSETAERSQTIELATYVRNFGVNGYKAVIARELGVVIDELPTWDRFPFDFQDDFELNVAITTTSYGVTGASQPRVATTSFDAVFVENDIPNTHRAFANTIGYFSTGHYEVAGNVNGFSIINSDNSGGPSSLTISNLTYTIEPGSYGQIVATDQVAAYRFVFAIPEPSTYALMLGGLVLVGAAARRRAR